MKEFSCLHEGHKIESAEPGFEPRENDPGESQHSQALLQKEGGDGPMAFGAGLPRLLSLFSMERCLQTFEEVLRR